MREHGNDSRNGQTYVVSAARTPIGKFGGAFIDTPAVELGGVAIRAAVDRLVADDREAELDEAIVAGYRAVPDEENDPWVEAATRAMVQDEPW